MTSLPRWPLPGVMAALLAACGGGGSGFSFGCNGSCASATTYLQVADVEKILSQAIAEAGARGQPATIAVVDRVGNVLAVYRMGDASTRPVLLATRLSGGVPTIAGGLEGIKLPVAAAPAAYLDTQAAITKALTAAYLSTEGNAFSTRTASQIIQEHFNPGEASQPSGPLFGVQFSQLACSDFMNSGAAVGLQPGPQRSPLGLAGDPGGFPLYVGGAVVGGIGVITGQPYSIDVDVSGTDNDPDEAIALAGSYGFAAPDDRRADRISLGGRTARFSDLAFNQLLSNPASAMAFSTIPGGTGALVNVAGYGGGTIIAGTAFGQAASGLRADTENNYPGADAFVLVTSGNALRYPPVAGQAVTGSTPLSADEVKTILQKALGIANKTRAQIRLPSGSQARVTITVVDHLGKILGMVSTRDPALFGADVSVQKARTAALFSSSDADTFLGSLPTARYIDTSGASVHAASSSAPGSYVAPLRSFISSGTTLLGDGTIAWSARSIGNFARPYYPDGIQSSADTGPLSKPAGQWSVFSTGLQLDVSLNSLLQHVLFVAGVVGSDVTPGCAGTDIAVNGTGALTGTITKIGTAGTRLANGLQIFPGGMPIYRNGTLVGAIGVSGDGVDQDDMIAFLGLDEAGVQLASGVGNAPTGRRADTLLPVTSAVRPRYVQCPQSPYISGSSEGVCDGK